MDPVVRSMRKLERAERDGMGPHVRATEEGCYAGDSLLFGNSMEVWKRPSVLATWPLQVRALKMGRGSSDLARRGASSPEAEDELLKLNCPVGGGRDVGGKFGLNNGAEDERPGRFMVGLSTGILHAGDG
ncbi:hypothetical protein H257_18219 [Aphanomyces astaci]|uniref:Uncharacterized protein n=1 Tax=Aphanomyces astaci TaxID=112090 RepID=W4FBW9_APHAT|nr:hypothetical protein H257_18219 [Aphanomyces astaci]ETV64977.1 hypothetical protein H257_18219 [Aphanomyces astaci]|eukprot:XP_009845540.1 hypothetical protein H257_18219 [Aphanomyces astaci]